MQSASGGSGARAALRTAAAGGKGHTPGCSLQSSQLTCSARMRAACTAHLVMQAALAGPCVHPSAAVGPRSKGGGGGWRADERRQRLMALLEEGGDDEDVDWDALAIKVGVACSRLASGWVS